MNGLSFVLVLVVIALLCVIANMAMRTNGAKALIAAQRCLINVMRERINVLEELVATLKEKV